MNAHGDYLNGVKLTILIMLTHFHDDLGKLRKSPLGTKDFQAWSWFPPSPPRDPPLLPHTSIALLNGSTQWRARATYSCLPGYQPSKGEIYEQPSFVKLFAVEKEQLRKENIILRLFKTVLQFVLLKPLKMLGFFGFRAIYNPENPGHLPLVP